jgi:hypothetical protein
MSRLLILIAFIATSCSPAYVSNIRNTPMLDEARQFVGGGTIGSSGLDLQLAYAVTDHIAIMANGNSFKSNVILNQSIPYTRKHLFGEAALGYFIKKDRLHFEVFAGYGMAEFNSYEDVFFSNEDRTTQGAYNRAFVQPSITLNRGAFKLILTTRFSGVDFISYTAKDVKTGEIVSKTFRGYQGFFEPALSGRFKIYKFIEGYCQAGINGPMNGPLGYDQNALQLAFGLQFRTSPKSRNDN